MSTPFPSDTTPGVARIILVRHGSTEWSRNGRHTGHTDLRLDQDGEQDARALGPRLSGLGVRLAYSSPLRRALDTCHLAGFPDPIILEDLREWDYGDYEGLTTAEILAIRPGWSIFTGGCPNGENSEQVGIRAARSLEAIPIDEHGEGAAVVFAHAHLLRVLCVTYLHLEPRAARLMALDTASISILGFERERRVLRVWNS